MAISLRNQALAHDIERIGANGPSKQFTIDASNSRAFKVLSSTLYRDKILAVVREYSTNARDAHMMAGVGDQPFHVHLPNSLEPYFSVRDNGLGLSDNDVRQIWSSYFTSTKNTEEIAGAADKSKPTGTLGLGSKSAFAFVDSFTLVSRHGGFKRTYTAFINETGCPEIVMMGEPVATDEGNGVEVIIPVERSSDFREFSARASTVYELFDPPPIVTGVANFKPNHSEVILSCDGWRLTNRTSHGARAIMGGLAYPINEQSIQGASQEIRNVLRAPIDIDFALDSLDFTAGREDLSYDLAMTQPALRARLSEVYKQIVAMVTKDFGDCETEYLARRMFGEMFGYRYGSSRQYSMRDIIVAKIQWKGIVIENEYMNINLKEFSADFSIDYCDLTTNYRTGEKYVRRRTKQSRSATGAGVCSYPTGKGLAHLILDLKTDYTPRIRNFMIAQKHQDTRLISGSADDIAKLRENLAGCEFILVSDLPKPEATPRRKARVRVLGSTNYSRSSMSYDWMTEVDVSPEDDGVFVVLRNGTVDGFGDNKSFFETYNNALAAKLVEKEKIHVISPSLMKDFEGTKWVLFSDKLNAAVTAGVNDPAFSAAVGTQLSIEEMRAEGTYEIITGRFHNNLLAQLGDHKLAVTIREFHKAAHAANHAKETAAKVNLAKKYKIEISAKPDAFASKFANFRKQYPMLFISLGRSGPNDGETHAVFVEYIKMCDNHIASKTPCRV